MNPKRSLITGCGRSGTLFTTQLLQALGYDARHERSGGQGTVCWYCCQLLTKNINRIAGVTRCGCHYPGITIDHRGEAICSTPGNTMSTIYDLVMHQTRSPLEVIASIQTLTEGSINYIRNKIIRSDTQDLVLLAARYWIDWNRAAERMSDYSYRVEDMDYVLPDICEQIGIEYNPDNCKKQLARNGVNKRRHVSIDIDVIRKRDKQLHDELRETADHLGYQI